MPVSPRPATAPPPGVAIISNDDGPKMPGANPGPMGELADGLYDSVIPTEKGGAEAWLESREVAEVRPELKDEAEVKLDSKEDAE